MSSEDYIFKFNTDRCKKCGLCSHYCPRQVIAVGNNGYPYAAAPEKCKKCYLCFHRCPDFALEVKNDAGKTIFAGQ